MSKSAVLLLLSITVGSFVGLGVFTFGYGDGAAYLSNNPAACTNCHIMQSNFDSWQHSSHHTVAGCNDCHTPHHPIYKWLTKADNGFFHSLAFTFGNFHEPIEIKPRNHRVAIGTCLFCHEKTVHQMSLGNDLNEVNCVRCHADVGHALR